LTAVALLLGNSMTVVAQTSAQPLTAPQALASDYGCMTCHGLVRKQVGPGFAQISARYQGDAQAATRLAAKIRNGSVGAWGRVVMPRQTRVSEADAVALAGWVLSQPPLP
jgi:cytochrome c